MANQKSVPSKKKLNLHTVLQTLIAVVLILGGFFLIAYSGRDRLVGSSSFLRQDKQFTHSQSSVQVVHSSQTPNDGQVQKLEAKPYKLYIPKLHKILYVSDGVIVDGRWIVSDSGVSYLTTSPLPGKVGNSVLYGHNLDSILGRLPSLSPDDLVYVVMDNGSFYKYKIFERKEVKPNAVEILKNSNDSRITIYTCSGFLDSARFVVVGKLVDR